MSVNKVILVGRLGHSPEVRYTAGGDAVASFSLATDERWKDAKGEKRQRTEWHSVTMFGKLGEIAGQYLKKGSLVYVSGKIRSERYTDRQGVERTAYKIHADELKMLGDGKADSAPPQTQQYAPQQPQYAPPPHDDVPF